MVTAIVRVWNCLVVGYGSNGPIHRTIYAEGRFTCRRVSTAVRIARERCGKTYAREEERYPVYNEVGALWEIQVFDLDTGKLKTIRDDWNDDPYVRDWFEAHPTPVMQRRREFEALKRYRGLGYNFRIRN